MAWKGRECKQTISVGKCIVAWHREEVRAGELEVREGEVFRVEYVQSPRYVLCLYCGTYCTYFVRKVPQHGRKLQSLALRLIQHPCLKPD
ncbi:hypothetical protein CaCOL14_004287 [Colletotrichum acutatum]